MIPSDAGKLDEARRTIQIAGAGIAGLTAALFLSAKGFRIEVHEKASAFETKGAGIQISPNAMHVLASLGLERQLKTYATTPDSVTVFNARNGEQLSRMPLGHVATKRYGHPYLVIHRADLHSVLISACKNNPDIEILMDHEVVDATSHPNGVTILVKAGTSTKEARGVALVAADGVWSKTRTNALEIPAPIDSGYCAWRSLIRSDTLEQFMTDNTNVWITHGAHAVTYPVRNGRYVNAVIITKGIDKDLSPKLIHHELIDRTKKFHSSIKSIVEENPNWSAWPVWETPSFSKMTDNSIVLIGDAAHAMLPFAAQGAAMGIEDAAVLASHLEPNCDIKAALEKFEKERIPRVRKTMAFAKKNAHIFHMRQPFSTFRNIGMALMPEKAMLARQDWLFNWKAE